jgi:KDO2-lipid IV(A) lauroyltransferase
MFEKHGAAKKMVKALNNKRIVAMAIDQNISKSKGITLDFFGYKVTQTDSPIRVASKLDAIIIPMLFVRDGMFNHKAVFYEPMNIENNCTEDSIIKYSQQISNIFEKQIKEEPKDWFWQHRRFKEYYNKIYITN